MRDSEVNQPVPVFRKVPWMQGDASLRHLCRNPAAVGTVFTWQFIILFGLESSMGPPVPEPLLLSFEPLDQSLASPIQTPSLRTAIGLSWEFRSVLCSMMFPTCLAPVLDNQHVGM